MAAADSGRVWFSEMLEALEKEWDPTLSWEECGALCDRMTDARKKLRSDRGIKNVRLRCRHCNEVHEMDLAPITIRSMLYALRKQGRLTDEELQKLDKTWQRYRRRNGLDGRAKKRAEPGGPPNAGSASLHQHR